MPELAKFCCFACPLGDFTEKALEQCCPTCNRPFGFPLSAPPQDIGSYRIIKPLGRGFYACTYVAEKTGALKTKHVLKVSPTSLYTFFKKDFNAESERHAQVADGAEYVVGITDVFDADVVFGDFSASCHVAVLDYVEGVPLSDLFTKGEKLLAGTAAQIAADLFRLKAELESRLVNHNDLHASNIIVERLTPGRYRQGAMDPSVRVVAIDLGSVAPDRRSGNGYLGDLHWIAQHVQALVEVLLREPDTISDLDSRVANALQMIAQSIAPALENQRTPDADDFVHLIEEQYFKTSEPWRPWRNPLVLKTFNASYNAQTLDAWHVPQLLVDPEGAWLARISAPGPLVMTGMRGCGKTLLLRAVQFHARAARHADETDADVMTRLSADNYVGLFVSAQRLLNVGQSTESQTRDLFPRLFVAYALEAARALAHLLDISPEKVRHDAQAVLLSAVLAALDPSPAGAELATVEQLGRHLSGMLVKLSRSDSKIQLATHPANAFANLAEAVRSTSALWASAQVLFLLDDVSTRYMAPDRVEDVLSALIFQNPNCAFKMTSEAQTIFLSLKSPGTVNPAAHWRDFATFDLGEEVNQRLKLRDGKPFVEMILQQRAKFYPGHPRGRPSEVLGEGSREQIAEIIARSKPDSRDRKRVYRGLTALTAVCVGDIGSVITIYENMLTRSGGRIPVPDDVQNDVFQDYCSRHLYLLDRREGHLKAVAQSFAEAAHELLIQSGRQGGRRRLRQYASIYVRITTGDRDEQMARLRELVDAGVFVFTGGAARTKTRDSNPTQQFKLTFRKIYGLVNFIGLAERDRFELSGKDLEEWLSKPADGKAILMRNLRPDSEPGDDAEEVKVPIAAPPRSIARQGALDLTLPTPTLPEEKDLTTTERLLKDVHLPLPTIEELDLTQLTESRIDTVVMLALGFEERTKASAARLLAAIRPRHVVALRYPEPGYSDDILQLVEESGADVRIIDYADLLKSGSISFGERSVVDITGLAKPAIFQLVREALIRSNGVDVAYTAAEHYFPLEADLGEVVKAFTSDNYHQLLLSLKGVLTGEGGPYRCTPQLPDDSDGTRLRGLLAFASPKHERLIQLVEERDYDLIEVMVSDKQNSRTKIAQIAAQVAVRGQDSGNIRPCNTSDPAAVLQALAERYEAWSVRDGLNFEIGLTGNKIQTVAAAAFSASYRVNQAWYVSPTTFDRQRFTTGVGDTRVFRIRSVRL
jgi:hypothetical protein